MKRLLIVLFALAFICVGVSGAQAVTTNLFDYAFNIDGIISEHFYSDPIPGDTSLFNASTGLGTISITGITGAGSHKVIGFFDHEIDEPLNTFFNEYGSTSGTEAAGQSWEIDEPGFVFGDIYDNMLAGTPDMTNGVPLSLPDDVSMAMGWDFMLAANEIATIDFILSDAAGAGFNLIQTDPDSQYSIYFSSILRTEPLHGCGQPIPEPGTLMLLGSGLAGLAGFGRKRFRK